MATTTSFLPFSATLILLLLLLSSTPSAIRISRTSNLMHEGSLGDQKDSNNIHLDNAKENWETPESVTSMKERMNLELNDYPGSGANNRHTPRP